MVVDADGRRVPPREGAAAAFLRKWTGSWTREETAETMARTVFGSRATRPCVCLLLAVAVPFRIESDQGKRLVGDVACGD